MNKSVVGGLVVLIIVLAGGGLLLANKDSNKDDTNTTTSTNSTEESSSSSTKTTPVATTSVSIKDMAFSPADIAVKVGDTVTWTNNDSVAHTVTETDSQSGPKSDSLEPGKSYVFTFDHAGTYKYHCSFHSGMTGTVTVTER